MNQKPFTEGHRRGDPRDVVRSAQSFRSFVGRPIARLFPPREAALMGLALGDDSRLDPAPARDFQATGLGHLLVVSGHTEPNGPPLPNEP